jgi:hypothetical protein
MKRKKPSSESLPRIAQEKYARLKAQGAKQVDALKICKISKNTAGRWEKDSAVQARINYLVNQTLEDQRSECKKEYRKISIDRNDIIMGLADLAGNPLTRDSARVAAFGKLADIFCLVPRSLRDAKEFYGWTEEELDEYRRTEGEFVPERFKPHFGTSEMDAHGANPSRKQKKRG